MADPSTTSASAPGAPELSLDDLARQRPAGPEVTRTRRRGRPSSFTAENRNAILLALANCNTLDDAAEFAGVGASTVYTWLDKGERAKTGEYREFLEAVRRAKAQAKVLLVGRAYKHTHTDGRLALDMLSRRWPGEWGRKDAHAIGIMDGRGGAGAPEKMESARDKLAAKLAITGQRLLQSAAQTQATGADPATAEGAQDGDLPAGGLGILDILPSLRVVGGNG